MRIEAHIIINLETGEQRLYLNDLTPQYKIIDQQGISSFVLRSIIETLELHVPPNALRAKKEP